MSAPAATIAATRKRRWYALDDFELLARLGVEVIESSRLRTEMCLLEGEPVAVLRKGLPPSARREAAAWLVAEVLLLGAGGAS